MNQTNHTHRLQLFRQDADRASQLRLRLCHCCGDLTLSDTVPVLENFGFRVIDHVPPPLQSPAENGDRVHEFLLALPPAQSADQFMAHAPIVAAALAAVCTGEAENDPFNRLIGGLGLDLREANWLRACYRYLRQTGSHFGLATVVEALGRAPMVTQGLLALFRARHARHGIANRAASQTEAEAAIQQGLANVAAINDDRLLRAFHTLILAILRTNAFVEAGREALAFKMDSAAVPGLPHPVPWREIFVYSPRLEAIHLRAGPVARGGIRWSDRRDDFRTEVLGLMKAQRVKNAVIVPTGAKGGFYPKRLPDPAQDRQGWAAEGRATYEIFIRAALSLTDNLVEGRIVHPAGMVIHDDPDPYFVVAADKGTASFSDTANALARAAGFWLGDAFASGGSNGYDHKAMGITARGAWISVSRHFAELGTDIATDPVRVAGVGDMSGDVFGNAMLLSKSIRLVAAFDHRHIFLDPAPDPAASWAERARLFALPRSSWDDYDKALISPGGGVFSRGQKSIPLSPQIAAALGLAVTSLDPESLIRAILAAPVDLLWFGGIGTYVKAPGEANAQVGDPANDPVRVDACAIRARVIGEGANLACTQAGRIGFALAGGRINTDFIDNSAGVACSDKEVNIKIALASALSAGRLDEPARTALLAKMTPDVAALVLEDNRLQTLGLSIAEHSGAASMPLCLRLIEVLEAGGHLDRTGEGLADAETLARRATDGMGLTRPELAVLLSSAKLVLQAELEASALPDDPDLAGEALAAFPPAMRANFAADILAHRLRREIIATRLANRLINRLGFIHPFELAEEEGVDLAEVAAAFVAAERLLGMADVWQSIERATMAEPARLALLDRAAHGLRLHVADLLRAGAATAGPLQLAARLAPGGNDLADATEALLRGENRVQSARMRQAFAAAGAPEPQALLVTRLFDLDGAIGLARLACDCGTPALPLAQAFVALGTALGLDWAQTATAALSPSDPWERLLVSGLARDFQQMRFDFLRRMGGAAVEDWLASRAVGVRHLQQLVARARAAPAPNPVMLAQIASQARNLLAR